MLLCVAGKIFIEYQSVVFKATSEDGKIEVVIEQDFIHRMLAPAAMGGYEYTVSVYEKHFIFKEKLKSEEVWYINDGATLKDSNINIEWADNWVEVKLTGEGNPKYFSCFLGR